MPAVVVAATNDVVYADGLSPHWEDWSWGTTLDFANTSPALGGSGRSIGVSYREPWAGLYLHTVATLGATEYTALRFSIHGGASGGQQLRLLAYDASYREGQIVSIAPPPANTWTEVTVPLSAFELPDFSGFVWQEISGGAQPALYLDDIVVTACTEPRPPIALSVDPTAARRPISPHIYGMNFAREQTALDVRLPVNRWGGNATSRYNWQFDTANHGSDWYFLNVPKPNEDPEILPDGSTIDYTILRNRVNGTDSLVTVPLIGWTCKARASACGFSVAKYGPQQETEPWDPDCGNGVRLDGTLITGNDPRDTSVPIGPEFVSEWVSHLVGRFGPADSGGVRFYSLDNEPMLWHETHRDVHPQPVSYDELRDRTYAHASAIKSADPGALTLGPVLWGWSAYFYSAADTVGGGDWWNRCPDRKAHGDVPLVEWYLQQMRAYEQTHGTRILDYLDLHYYPQAAGVTLSPVGDAATQSRRLRSTRSLWDPSYVDESWIAEPVRLIPRMREWVDRHYPGTKLAISEYCWGGHEDINGALAQADVLGIFGREGLDLATLWATPEPEDPGAFVFRMYRNYDGEGAAFGETSVGATSSDQARIAIYAAETGSGDLTLMLINKTAEDLEPELRLENFTATGSAQVYRYSAVDLTRIVREADATVDAAGTVHLPASSITLLVVPRGAPRADLDGDGDVDADDLSAFRACASGAGVTPPASCSHTDFDFDGDVDADDFGAVQRCLGARSDLIPPGC
jgi:hypothetical protein